MSLDVWLTVTKPIPYEGSGIFIRENGRRREITREEWNERFPDREPVMLKPESELSQNTVFDYNITHNLNTMAKEAGIYYYLWRPEEVSVAVAQELIVPLTEGLAKLKADPDHYRTFNPSNGIGDYEGLVKFVEEYLAACEQYPDATVGTWA